MADSDGRLATTRHRAGRFFAWLLPILADKRTRHWLQLNRISFAFRLEAIISLGEGLRAASDPMRIFGIS